MRHGIRAGILEDPAQWMRLRAVIMSIARTFTAAPPESLLNASQAELRFREASQGTG